MSDNSALSFGLRDTAIAVDLEQLAVRESEQIEWKENVASVDDVAKTLSAFANDLANLGGGYVICGAREDKDEYGFPKLVKTGLSANQVKEIEGKILQRCRDRVAPPITPLVAELPSDASDRRILVFIQPSTGSAHTARLGSDGAKHFVRVGRETREARNGTLRELLVRKGAKVPWDRQICTHATIDDLDLLALRDALQRMKLFSSEKGLEAYPSAETQLSAMVPPLCEREALTGVLRPRNFTVLLFGREPQKFIPGAFSLFSIYPGRDRSDVHAERHEIAGTVIEQSRRLNELLDLQSFTTFDKSDNIGPNAVKYPRRALYEAMGNALAHRDYEEADPVRVTVFEDRIEILSPGSLPLGVDETKFKAGQASPRWRNQSLAWFFNRLQIAQAEVQGIPTILRVMREEGCPPPEFDVDETRVLCTLPAHPRYATLRELRSIEQDLAIGDWVEAERGISDLLSRDPTNVQALKLFGELQASLRQPIPVLRWLSAHPQKDFPLPRDVALQFAEALLSGENTTNEQRMAANRLLGQASMGRLEEQEFRRIVVALIRSRNQKQAIRLLDDFLREHPESIHSPSFHQLRGDALIGMASKCANAARRGSTPRAVRERSWIEFERYVTEAENHLNKAMQLDEAGDFANLTQRNIDYLETLKARNRRRRTPRK